jgi:hypothetical protein
VTRAPARLRAGSVLGALGLLVLAACAPLPPERQVTDVAQIAGRWQGQIKFGGGSYQLFYLTINPDGSLVATWDGITRYGKVTIEGPRTRFGFYIWSGSLDYLEGNGERVILMREDFGGWDAIVRPLA